MKKYILIQNDGEIETNSFELIGASTKRDDNTKIGFFGSGLKYSIAFMMRNCIDFRIFSGERELVFSIKSEMLKGQPFERICINGAPTSYTTTMGPTWEHEWFVLREIYCNALDEGTCQLIKSTDTVSPSIDKTRIYIELTSNLQNVISEWDSYFSDERDPLFVTESVYTSSIAAKRSRQPVKVYSKSEGVLYRKGIRVGQSEDYLFDYELEHVDINEDRTAKNLPYMHYTFINMASQFCNDNWLLTALRNKKSSEYKSLQSSYIYDKFNERWVDFSKDYLLVVEDISGKYSQKINESPKEALYLPYHFAKELKTAIPEVNVLGIGRMIGDYGMMETEMTSKMIFLLKEVKNSLSEMGYEVPYDIAVAEFNKENILGKADIENKKIYIADITFEKGRRELALTLMEEAEHIKSGAEDETRKFQDHLFNKWLSYMEDKNGLFL